jgi:hypothetical protein
VCVEKGRKAGGRMGNWVCGMLGGWVGGVGGLVVGWLAGWKVDEANDGSTSKGVIAGKDQRTSNRQTKSK